MARILDEFPEREGVIDWDEKTTLHTREDGRVEGRVWELHKGVDFVCSAKTVKIRAYKEAVKRGLNVRTRWSEERPEEVVVQFFPGPRERKTVEGETT